MIHCICIFEILFSFLQRLSVVFDGWLVVYQMQEIIFCINIYV